MMRFSLLSGAAGIAFAAIAAAPAIAGEVRGTVVDASETIALRAAQIEIEEIGRQVNSERGGTFDFGEVPAGTYTITARYVGADPVSQRVTVPETGAVTVNFALGQSGSQILVVGQGASQASALSRKRAADGVSDVLTRDAIGQFPDQNVAESLRRLPGINVLNDQGEGRFVAVRGLDPNLNATSVNGVRIPSPEGDIRGVALDVISSEIIESIEVKKSLTPDMDADTIGASIEINTTSAFDRKEDLYVVKLGGSYNELRDTLTPDLGADFAAKLTDNFGVSGGISYYNREFQTDNVEADDWTEDDGLIYAEEVQYRDYLVERERISATLGFDARVGSSTELYLRGVFSQFDDQEFRRRLTFDLGDANVSGSGLNPVFDDIRDPADPDDEAAIAVERDVKDRFERQRIRTVTFGGESQWGGLKAEYALAWAKSSERENGSVDPTIFVGEFEDSGLGVGFDYADERRPRFNVTGNTADFFDPSFYELDEIEFTALSDAEDEEFSGRLDLGYEWFTDAGTLTVQGGAKARLREKRFNGEIEFYERDDYTLADVLGEGPSNTLENLAPLPGLTQATDFFRDNFASFELNAVDTALDSANGDYSVEEDILAGYLLGRFENDQWLVIGGVRYERTDNRLSGFETALFEEGQDLPGGGVADDDTVIVTPVEFERDYDHWLPSLNIRYTPMPEFVMRFAGYRSIVRPNLEQLAPRFELDENREAVIGNPTLEPFEAWNLDASFEYYMTGNGAITAAFFYKDIDNYVTTLVLDQPGSIFGVDYEQGETFVNGPAAEIFGIELGFYQRLDFLPGFLDGLLVQANYTYTDASGLVADGEVGDITAAPTFREIPLPATSENTFNVALGYDKGPVSLRLAGTYRDGFLDEVNADGPEFDRFTDSLFQLDFTARYRVTDKVQVYFDWININDAEFYAFNRLGGRQNILQFERYNWTMKGGVRLNF
ncbi:TonB-dependent receptor [Erythrobacter litoralis]|uniref:TonB-dependent receptor n=1 Tax=Erythrobacter litoralis TaxID=39960 RepID=A0A074M5L2_9SPHN|nr:TonB-dependent receptor [Erythrobacter litoralis]AOL22631.1 TonB-dependent receptor [Erythrobacter litoralis]KEO90001.1 TonB-dependent receptor [Erythrobacter litoralis]